MSTATKQSAAEREQARINAEAARREELRNTNFTSYPDFQKFYDVLSVQDTKFLYDNNQSFKARIALQDQAASAQDNEALVRRFRETPAPAQPAFYNALLPFQKKVIDADYDRFMALTPEQQQAELTTGNIQPVSAVVVDEAAAQAAAAAEAQATADRLAEEAAASGTIPTVPKGTVEELYDGVEKMSDGAYRLTVPSKDGLTPDEIFFGKSQKDCFKALRKAKSEATAEIRRRKKKAQISNDLKAMGERVNYPPLVEPLTLSPDDVFTLTERRKELKEQLDDPTTVIKATREIADIDEKFRRASLSQADCDVINQPELNRRYNDSHNTALRWIKENPDFYRDEDSENTQALQNLMITLDWAVTEHNLDLAFAELKKQGVLLMPSEPEAPVTSSTQPASVVPVVAVPVVPATPIAAKPATPSATPGALPDSTRVLRPGSSSTGLAPTRRIESVSTAAPQVVLTVETYNQMPAAEAKRRYLQDPQFHAAVEKLIAEGKI